MPRNLLCIQHCLKVKNNVFNLCAQIALAAILGCVRSRHMQQSTISIVGYTSINLPTSGWPARPETSAVGARDESSTAPTIAQATKLPLEDRFALGAWEADPAAMDAGRPGMDKPS